MRLKTKLVLAATGVTLLVVLVLSGLFLAQLLSQRIVQTAAANEVLANEVRSATRDALESGIGKESATDGADLTEAELLASVKIVLRQDSSLQSLMDSIVRYSLTVQDVSITNAHNITLMSTDPDTLDQPANFRASLGRVGVGGFYDQWQEVFGPPGVLDVAAPLTRNGKPFVVVHVGVRSTFLKASFAPGLREALIFAVPAAIVLVFAAGLLTNISLRPLETINAQLELLTAGAEDESAAQSEGAGVRPDTVVRVAKSIDRLERTMRNKEAGYTALQTNMEQMLDTLRDGVLLFAADRSGELPGDPKAVMVSDAVAHFLFKPESEVQVESTEMMIGRRVEEIFVPESFLGAAVLAAFKRGGNVSSETVQLEDGRQVQISLDRIDDGQGKGVDIGTLLTLRDMESALQLEQELEVSRRLAAIGRITAGVGHEVKNPINAMVLHLELLRGKLAASPESGSGAQRHVEILASEMQRLDRVVQTLADFSRPMELHLCVVDLRDIVAAVVELTWEQMRENNVTVRAEAPREPLMVYVDSELIRQALLNLVLNGMQAMADGGVVLISLRREQGLAVIEVKDKGTGIQEDLLPRIFELYFTTKKTGSGIGLATTYRILQMHGGALDVRSSTDLGSADHGSVFSVRLPIAALSPTMRVDLKHPVGARGRGERA
jgi:signal transduction histidine kinase